MEVKMEVKLRLMYVWCVVDSDRLLIDSIYACALSTPNVPRYRGTIYISLRLWRPSGSHKLISFIHVND